MSRNLILVLALLLSISPNSFAHGDDVFDEARELVEAGVSCDQLNDEQLEMIGDYYMEQMHPGEAHEAMDQMMGGEGSESLREIHINMARRGYCGGDTGMHSYGINGGGNMMNNFGNFGMTGFGMGYGFIWWIAIVVLVVLLVVWLAQKQTTSRNPQEILKERLAKGDITKKEYEEKLRILKIEV